MIERADPHRCAVAHDVESCGRIDYGSRSNVEAIFGAGGTLDCVVGVKPIRRGPWHKVARPPATWGRTGYRGRRICIHGVHEPEGMPDFVRHNIKRHIRAEGCIKRGHHHGILGIFAKSDVSDRAGVHTDEVGSRIVDAVVIEYIVGVELLDTPDHCGDPVVRLGEDGKILGEF